jgi:hypothetical protein
MGRYWSPDPGGIKSADRANPGSWNLYTYGHGDPINFNDPRGLDPNCGPGMSWDGEGCTQGTTLNGAAGTADCWSLFGMEGCDSDTGDNPCGGQTNGFLEGPDPNPCPVGSSGPTATQPSCEDLLMDELNNFLSGTNFAGDAFAFEATGASYNIDPRLIAAMARGENGQAKNNPFGLGRNGSASFSSLGAALAFLGQTLDKYIYTWNETTVSQLWSGNTWQVNPKKPWITTQYPGDCVGADSAAVAACQATGANISQFMVSMSGNPNSLGFPCPD